MCIACEIAFMDILNALSPQERERVLRENAERFSCETPLAEPAAPQAKDEREP